MPNRRCSTNQDVRRTLCSSSGKAPRAASVMKYLPPARGDSTFTPARAGAADSQNTTSVPQTGQTPVRFMLSSLSGSGRGGRFRRRTRASKRSTPSRSRRRRTRFRSGPTCHKNRAPGAPRRSFSKASPTGLGWLASTASRLRFDSAWPDRRYCSCCSCKRFNDSRSLLSSIMPRQRERPHRHRLHGQAPAADRRTGRRSATGDCRLPATLPARRR